MIRTGLAEGQTCAAALGMSAAQSETRRTTNANRIFTKPPLRLPASAEESTASLCVASVHHCSSLTCRAGTKLAARCRMREYAPGIRSSELSMVDTQTNSAEETPAQDAALPSSAAQAPAESSEDRFLAKARDEHVRGHVDPALWARAVAQAGSDEAKSLRIYLDKRATAIRVAKRQEKAARKARVVEALSQPDPGVELPAPVTAQAAPSKSTRGRSGG